MSLKVQIYSTKFALQIFSTPHIWIKFADNRTSIYKHYNSYLTCLLTIYNFNWLVEQQGSENSTLVSSSSNNLCVATISTTTLHLRDKAQTNCALQKPAKQAASQMQTNGNKQTTQKEQNGKSVADDGGREGRVQPRENANQTHQTQKSGSFTCELS